MASKNIGFARSLVAGPRELSSLRRHSSLAAACCCSRSGTCRSTASGWKALASHPRSRSKLTWPPWVQVILNSIVQSQSYPWPDPREAALLALTLIREDRTPQVKCCASCLSICSHGSRVRVSPLLGPSETSGFGRMSRFATKTWRCSKLELWTPAPLYDQVRCNTPLAKTRWITDLDRDKPSSRLRSASSMRREVRTTSPNYAKLRDSSRPHYSHSIVQSDGSTLICKEKSATSTVKCR